MFFFAVTLSVILLSVFLLRRFHQRCKSLDSYNKSEIIDKALSMRHKTTNYKDFKEMLTNATLENNKLLPVCVEMVETIQNTLPVYTPPKSKRYFKRSKFYVPRIDIKTMEAAMESECIDFEDFVDIEVDDISHLTFNNEQITMKEFDDSFKKDAINKLDFMKLSKTHLINIPKYLKQQLINIFNKMIWEEDTENIKEHAVGISYLIYKESKHGPLDEKSSYRTITTIPVVVNCFHRILSMRLMNYFLNNNIVDTNIHKGAIPKIKYGVLEQIIKVKNIIRSSNQAHIMFVDISNAFPSLNIKRLFTLLSKYGVDEKIINYIRNYYDNLEYKTIISKGNITQLKPWKQGLIQGCPMSPILFIIVMNYITNLLINKYGKEYGYMMENNSIMFTAFLDDICLITNSKEGLEIVFNEMKDLFEMFGLKINMDKTKILSNEQYPGLNIECVNQVTYLGETIELDSNLTQGYKNIFKILIKKLYRTDKASYNNERKIQIFSAYILPWLQRKLIVNYDFSLEQKTNLRKVVYYFMGKWGYTEKILLQNTLETVMKSSNDPYIKEILPRTFTKLRDQDTETLDSQGKRILIKYKFRY